MNENSVEIIDGVPVDWSKFKSKTKGKTLDSVKNIYIKFCKILHANNCKLIGEYVSSRKPVLISDMHDKNNTQTIQPSNYVFKHESNYKHKLYNKACDICGKEFMSHQPHARFCSDACRDSGKKFYSSGKTYKNICVICNNHFETGTISTQTCSSICNEILRKNKAESTKNKSKGKNKHMNKDNYSDIVSFAVKELINKGIEGRDNCGISFYYSSSGFTSTLKDQAKDRDNWNCSVCGNKHRLEVHHIVKIRHGGENELDNLITLCVSCHRSIDTLDLDHALKICTKNAEKYLGIEEKTTDYRTTKEKIEDVGFDLRAVYNLLRKKSDDPDIQDALIKFNDSLEVIEQVAGF